MKRLLSLVISAIFATGIINAATITPNQAMSIAQRFSRVNLTPNILQGNATTLQMAYAARNGQHIDYYAFNRGNDSGFIIVSGDDTTVPVWGYSEQGTFDINRLPCNMLAWLEEYQQQLQWLRDHPDAAPRKTTTLTTSVSPLLSTIWGQGSPFNRFCPVIDSRHCVTGCLATALAQIMYYHKWPNRGEGDNSYSLTQPDGSTINVSADFSQSYYQWDSMLDSYNVNYTSAQANAVARLMSDAGVAIYMKYGPSSSSANYSDIMQALIANFDYNPSIKYYLKDYYSGDWDAMLRAELDTRRPIYYSGQTNSNSGHAFVLDGYRSDGYFHVNWGWGGDCDGYFLTSLLSPTSSSNYSYNQRAFTDIYPDKTGQGGLMLKKFITPVAPTMPANDMRATFEVQALGGPYSGNVRVAFATKTGEDSYSWNYSKNIYIELAAGERKTIHVYGSSTMTTGKTYYLFLINPYISIANYYWGKVAPFVIGEWPAISGDVNGDKEVNIADINAVIATILGVTNDPACDVNNDTEVNIADINAVINIILNQ